MPVKGMNLVSVWLSDEEYAILTKFKKETGTPYSFFGKKAILEKLARMDKGEPF